MKRKIDATEFYFLTRMLNITLTEHVSNEDIIRKWERIEKMLIIKKGQFQISGMHNE